MYIRNMICAPMPYRGDIIRYDVSINDESSDKTSAND
jgi:hypothetical protein